MTGPRNLSPYATRSGRPGARPTGAVDTYHEWLHLHPGAVDMRTPSRHPETGALSWTLRPDLVLQGCIARGCRVRLYAYADGSTVDELEAGQP
jgi:hypothetical protein